jgi:hypothetical protein
MFPASGFRSITIPMKRSKDDPRKSTIGVRKLTLRLLRFPCFVLFFVLVFSPRLFGQSNPPPARRPAVNSDSPALSSPQNSPGKTADSPITNQQIELLTKATEKLLVRIQEAENDLYLRVNYFEKPERLDPNSYASKDEVAQWRTLLQQLKDKSDFVSQLYTNLGRDLDTELKRTGESENLTSRFKATILEGFPWETIEKKKQLLSTFVEQHGKLLTFYEKNWGSWKPGTEAGEPEFNSSATTSIYKNLRDQIVKTSGDIEEQYKAMSN